MFAPLLSRSLVRLSFSGVFFGIGIIDFEEVRFGTGMPEPERPLLKVVGLFNMILGFSGAFEAFRIETSRLVLMGDVAFECKFDFATNVALLIELDGLDLRSNLEGVRTFAGRSRAGS